MWDNGLNSSLCMWVSGCSYHLLNRLSFPEPLNYFSTFVENQLIINVRVDFWALNFVPLIYVRYLSHASTILPWLLWLCRNFWNQEVWIFQIHSSFWRLFWLFWVICISIQILELVWQSVQKKAARVDRDCTQSIY